MRSVLIGSVSSTAAALRGFLRGGLPLSGVCGLSREHAAAVSDFVDLEPLARRAAVPFLSFSKLNEPAVAELLGAGSLDWVFVIGLSQLMPAQLRSMARQGAVGFHPTPLPEGRGRAPVAWTILLNRPAAANLFFLTDEPDAGDIIDQRPVPVLPDDYAGDLIARTNQVLETMVADLAPAFASCRVPRRPQDHVRATYYARRRPEDGRIDWNRPTDEIYRLIRAVSRPYPGAFTYYAEEKVIVWRARPVETAFQGAGPVIGAGMSLPGDESSAAPGSVLAAPEGGPVIRTASGALQLTDMEWSGAGGSLRAGHRLG